MTKFKKQKFKIEAAQKFLKLAKNDCYAAEVLLTAPQCRPETVLYHVQQSIEKLLKAVLIHKFQVVNLTNDLDNLISEVPEDLRMGLPLEVGELTQYATIRRYLDGDELIEKEDLVEAIKAAKVYLGWAAKILG